MYTFAQIARTYWSSFFFTRGRFSHTVEKKKSKKTKEREIFSKQFTAHETTSKSRRQSSAQLAHKEEEDKRICTLFVMEALPNFFGNAGGQQSAEETGMDVDGEEVLCVSMRTIT